MTSWRRLRSPTCRRRCRRTSSRCSEGVLHERAVHRRARHRPDDRLHSDLRPSRAACHAAGVPLHSPRAGSARHELSGRRVPRGGDHADATPPLRPCDCGRHGRGPGPARHALSGGRPRDGSHDHGRGLSHTRGRRVQGAEARLGERRPGPAAESPVAHRRGVGRGRGAGQGAAQLSGADHTRGHDQHGAWREGTHDDLVLAVALACWYGETHPVHRFEFTSSGPSRWPSGPPLF
jgi:hypothetical protein